MSSNWAGQTGQNHPLPSADDYKKQFGMSDSQAAEAKAASERQQREADQRRQNGG